MKAQHGFLSQVRQAEVPQHARSWKVDRDWMSIYFWPSGGEFTVTESVPGDARLTVDDRTHMPTLVSKHGLKVYRAGQEIDLGKFSEVRNVSVASGSPLRDNTFHEIHSSIEVMGDDKHEVLGIDWGKRRLGVPTWGWGAALAALAGAMLLRRR